MEWTVSRWSTDVSGRQALCTRRGCHDMSEREEYLRIIFFLRSPQFCYYLPPMLASRRMLSVILISLLLPRLAFLWTIVLLIKISHTVHLLVPLLPFPD